MYTQIKINPSSVQSYLGDKGYRHQMFYSIYLLLYEKTHKIYIRKMEEYHFFLPKRFVELLESNSKRFDSLVPDEFDIGYEGDLDSLMNVIRDILKSLKDEKISFWKEVFERYKEDKEAYDLEFKTKETRRKKDLDRFSKIDINEYIDKLGSIGKEKKNS